jgi:hypothetical protein
MNDFYGDNFRWFIGDVVSIEDPVQVGRIKVRINGLHQDQVTDDDLPYAQTVVPINEGGTKELGNPLGIQVGARVFGFFMDGKDSQLPLVIGSMPKFEAATSGDRSTTRQSRGSNLLEDIKKEQGTSPDSRNSEPDSPYAAVYPHNKVTQTPAGHVIEIDDTPDAERIHIYHKSGSFVEFHPNGDVVTHHKNGFTTASGNNKIHIKGDLDIKVDGDYNLTVLGSKDEKILKSSSELVGAGKSINVIAGNLDLQSGAAGVINLNELTAISAAVTQAFSALETLASELGLEDVATGIDAASSANDALSE